MGGLLTRPGGKAKPADDRPTLAAVLDYYSVQYVPTKYGWQGIKCPVRDETNPSARVNLEEGAFFCNSCGVTAGDAMGLIMLMEHIPPERFYDALAFGREIPGEKQDGTQGSSPKQGLLAGPSKFYKPNMRRRILG